METVQDITTELMVRLGTSTTVSTSMYTDTILNNWLKNANKFATSYKKWSFTEGKISTTFSTSLQDDMGNTIIPYPEGWKADSIRILKIGGKKLDKLNFEDFLNFKENNPASTDRVYSDYGRQIYINTMADVSGTATVFGQYTPLLDPTDLTATTIFSTYDAEGNEAILEEMLSFAKLKEKNYAEALIHEKRAKEILDGIWTRFKGESFAYQTKDRDIFKRFNVLQGDFEEDNFKRDQF